VRRNDPFNQTGGTWSHLMGKLREIDHQ
jgi:hypothetical protein